MSELGVCDVCGGALTLCEDCYEVDGKPAPAWRDRPTGPGLWVLETDKPVTSPGYRFAAMDLTQEDLRRGAPFKTRRVYGPIPCEP